MAERQNYPVGDVDAGQLVQNTKPLTVRPATPVWGSFLPLTVSTTVVNLGTARGSYNRAFITVESNPIRFTVDGTLPTSSVGILLGAGDTLELESREEVFEFQAIRSSGVDSILSITFGISNEN